MHILVTWKATAQPQRRAVIDREFENLLSEFEYARVFEGCCVVETKTDQDRKEIVEKLSEYARSVPEVLHFIASPSMTGGSYNGWLPKATWDVINLRTRR